jgi:hypothetical protein
MHARKAKAGGRDGPRRIYPAALGFFAFVAVSGALTDLFAGPVGAIVFNTLNSAGSLILALAISFELDRFRARRGRDSWRLAISLAGLAAVLCEPLNWLIGLIPVFRYPPHPDLFHLQSAISGSFVFLLWALGHLLIRSGDRAVAQERRIAAAHEAMIRSETEALLLSLDPAVLLEALNRISERLSSGAGKTAAETVIALAEHMRGSLTMGQAGEPVRIDPIPSQGDRDDLLFDEVCGRRRFRFWALAGFLALQLAVVGLTLAAPSGLAAYELHLMPQPILAALWCLLMEAVLARPGRRSPKRAYSEAAVLCSAGVVLSVVGLLATTVAMGALHRPFFLAGIPSFELFYVAPVFVTWSAVWFILDARRREIARLRAAAEIRQAALKARNAVLRQQISPHFLFNALNALYALILDGERAQALGVIAAIRCFVERVDDQGEGDFVPLSAELATQDAYLDIERVRFGDRLRVEWRAPADLQAAQVPHLILQPLVENAIKYAVSRTADPVRVEIAAERAGEELVLQVRDTGAPEAAPRPPGLGVGLKNVEGRLRSLYGEAGRLACAPLSPSGFVAEVRMPLVL